VFDLDSELFVQQQHVLIQGNVGIAVGDILKQLGVPLKCIQIQDKSGK
jgi:translation initiation factor 1 (eIF-1/SUI1)